MSEEDGFDHFLTTIGFGRWQMISIATTITVVMSLPLHLGGSQLLSAPMRFRCSSDSTFSNDTLDSYDDSIQEININGSNSETNSSSSKYYTNACLMVNHSINTNEFNPRHSNVTRHMTNMPSCPFIEYDQSIFSSTVISEYHLVCERSTMQPFYQMMYNIGGIVGSTIGGHIGDRWGRKRAVQAGCIINIIAIMGMVFVPFYPFLLLMRSFVGFTTQCMLVPAWNLALESTPARHRSLVGMLLGLPYSLTVVVFAGASYLIRSWHYLLLACSFPVLILLLPLSYIVDESPRWLLVQGRVKESKKILQKATFLNNAKLPDHVDSIIDKIVQANTSTEPERPHQNGSHISQIKSHVHKAWEYLSRPGMRIILIITPILWFLQSGLYLGVVINANNFTTSNPFLYVALIGIMDGSAILLFTPITPYFGRRTIVGFGLFLGGVLFLLDLLVSSDYNWAKWILVMAGFFLVAGAFQVNFLYAPELFPTEARTRGFALVNMVGNIGFTCAPLVTDMLVHFAWWVPSMVFGCSGIVASLMVPFLPETNHKPLPDTIQDVEDRRKAAKVRSKNKKAGVDNKGYEQGESVI
ncbi:organic cation transporter protein-like [Panulirus ornatus]|uniref:organic cation transporter protein-like n=1 Tax=Panulirus ornatus TaxID=150431 RepID=UPI003A8474C5